MAGIPNEINLRAVFATHTAAEWEAQIKRELKRGSLESLSMPHLEGFGSPPFSMASCLPALPGFSLRPGWQSWQALPISPAGWPQAEEALRVAQPAGAFLDISAAKVSDRPRLAANATALAMALPVLPIRIRVAAHDMVARSENSDYIDTVIQLIGTNPYHSLECQDPATSALWQGVWAQPEAWARALAALPLNKQQVRVAVAPRLLDAGGSAVQELAVALSAFHATSSLLADADFSFLVELQTGTQVWMDVAKLRAARHLLPAGCLLAANGAEFFLAAEQLHSNLIRISIAAMSAILGTATHIRLPAFDLGAEARNPAEGARLSTNILHLLKEECHLDAVADPTAGSPYLEWLTHQLVGAAQADALWQPNPAGLEKLVVEGALKSQVEGVLNRRIAQFGAGEARLVGVNRYRAPEETAHTPQPSLQEVAGQHTFAPLKAHRLAANFAQPTHSRKLNP